MSVKKRNRYPKKISYCVSSVVVSCSIVQFTVIIDHTICQMVCWKGESKESLKYPTVTFKSCRDRLRRCGRLWWEADIGQIKSEYCSTLFSILPLQFFPSPVKPDGQEPQEIELLFSVQGTPGKQVSLLQLVIRTSQCRPVKPALQMQL